MSIKAQLNTRLKELERKSKQRTELIKLNIEISKLQSEMIKILAKSIEKCCNASKQKAKIEVKKLIPLFEKSIQLNRALGTDEAQIKELFSIVEKIKKLKTCKPKSTDNLL